MNLTTSESHTLLLSHKYTSPENFGRHLRKVRKEAGYTMWQLSKKIGWPINRIEHLERGLYSPHPEEISELTHFLTKL